MADIEIKRGYEVLPDNNIRFGIRVINDSDFAISDVEVILDYSASLFELESNKIQHLGTIPPTLPRTAKFILKPLGCVHKEEIGATVRYKDHQWKKHVEQMRPKEVHCVCPFLKEKSITRADFLRLSNSGYLEERGVNFEGVSVANLVDFIAHTCKNRLYKVDEFPIENGKILYLAGDAVGEKAYYLLTAVVKEYEGLTQVLLRAGSDKSHGLNGFLNENLDNLRHLVISASAREIGIIRKEQVINIIDSVVQRSTISMEEGAPLIEIKDSMVQRADIKGDVEKKRREDEKLRKEREEQERLRRLKEQEERAQRERKAREDAERGESERKKEIGNLKLWGIEMPKNKYILLIVLLVLISIFGSQDETRPISVPYQSPVYGQRTESYNVPYQESYNIPYQESYQESYQEPYTVEVEQPYITDIIPASISTTDSHWNSDGTYTSYFSTFPGSIKPPEGWKILKETRDPSSGTGMPSVHGGCAGCVMTEIIFAPIKIVQITQYKTLYRTAYRTVNRTEYRTAYRTENKQISEITGYETKYRIESITKPKIRWWLS